MYQYRTVFATAERNINAIYTKVIHERMNRFLCDGYFLVERERLQLTQLFLINLGHPS